MSLRALRPADRPPALVLAAHGSPHSAHAPWVRALRTAVAATADGEPVEVGWLGFSSPSLTDAVRAAAAHGERQVAVVPLLLTEGYHARVDVPAALLGVPGAHQRPVLGPDPLLAEAVMRRLAEAGAHPGDAVVLAAAGSTDAAARAQCEELAAMVGARRGQPVRTAYATGPGPQIVESIGAARRVAGTGPGGRVFVATYLLGPGALADRVAAQAAAAGAVATAPLGTAPEVVELVRRRWLAPAAVVRATLRATRVA
jgi:sirohydrochlorin ferrochelatase